MQLATQALLKDDNNQSSASAISDAKRSVPLLRGVISASLGELAILSLLVGLYAEQISIGLTKALQQVFP